MRTLAKQLATAAMLVVAAASVAWITNRNTSHSIVNERECFPVTAHASGTLQRRSTFTPGTNATVANKQLQAASNTAVEGITLTGTTVRDPPYPARLRARLDEVITDETTNGLTLVCNLTVRGFDAWGVQRREVLRVNEAGGGCASASTPNQLPACTASTDTTATGQGALTNIAWSAISTMALGECTGFSGGTAATLALGRLRVWTSTVVALPMPIIGASHTRIGSTKVPMVGPVSRQSGTTRTILNYLQSDDLQSGTDNRFDATRGTVNITAADVTASGDTFCLQVFGPEGGAPLGLESR